jgi:phytoene/squalene synthetase
LSAGPIIARQQRLAPALAASAPYRILGYAQGVAVLVGFLLLSVLGLAWLTPGSATGRMAQGTSLGFTYHGRT